MQFIDLLLVRWIFGRQIGHKNYEDFEHPTLQGALSFYALYPGRCPELGASAPSGRTSYGFGHTTLESNIIILNAQQSRLMETINV